MNVIRKVAVASALAALTLSSSCGNESDERSAERPDPTAAKDLVLETAQLILSEPDFQAACENISTDRRSGLCTEDVRSMAQLHLMDEGLPFGEEDIPEPKTGESGCVVRYGDGSMPVFGSVTVVYTGYAWAIDTIENLARQQGEAATLDYSCPKGLTNPE